MQQFTYIIQDSLGIHARPAGLLVKEAKQYPDTTLTLTKDGKSAKLNQLMRLLSLGVKPANKCQALIFCNAANFRFFLAFAQ